MVPPFKGGWKLAFAECLLCVGCQVLSLCVFSLDARNNLVSLGRKLRLREVNSPRSPS